MSSLYDQNLSNVSWVCDPQNVAQAASSVLKDPHPLLKALELQQDLEAYKSMVEALSTFKTVVVFGTGGSSLGAKSLVDLKPPCFRYDPSRATPVVHFMDNVDPFTLDALFHDIIPEETAFLGISKSGSTAETLSQFLAALRFMREAVPEPALSRHFYVITEPKDSPLTRLSRQYGFQTLDHPLDIGGRFSVFSCVGLVPAMVSGISVEDVLAGALDVWNAFKACPQNAPATLGASALVAAETQQGVTTTVLMPYCDRLATFSAWHRQLWAESLGKEGKGTLPAPALGTVDQHSQLQLFLEGPKDKLYTLISVGYQGASQTFDKQDLACDSQLSYLKDKTLADLMVAEYKATGQTLINHGCPVRFINLPTLSERSLGGLMMHFMLETMMAAKLLHVNAYDQPAVEESKRLTRSYLKEKSCDSAPFYQSLVS